MGWLDQYSKIAKTSKEQEIGLNNPLYDVMTFPGSGERVFRGLDNFMPVQIKDEKGKTKILKGPQDTATFTGQVKEKRMQKGGPTNYWETDKHKWLDSNINANTHMPWVKDLYNPNINQPQLNYWSGDEDLLYVAPTENHYMNGQAIPFSTPEQAEYFIQNQEDQRTPIPENILKQRFPKKQEGGTIEEHAFSWLEEPIQNPLLNPRQRQFKGRVDNQVNRSHYMPHSRIPKLQTGGEYNPYQKNIDYLNTISPEQMKINQLQAQQNNTPAIGQNIPWQDRFRNATTLEHYLPSGALSEVGRAANFVGYPATAAVNLTQPSRYFQQSNKLDGVADMFLDATAAATLGKTMPKFSRKSASKPYTGNFPIESIKKNKGATPPTTLTGKLEKDVPLTKEQQILQNLGLDPYKTRIPDEVYKKIDRTREATKRVPNMFMSPNSAGNGEIFEHIPKKHPEYGYPKGHPLSEKGYIDGNERAIFPLDDPDWANSITANNPKLRREWWEDFKKDNAPDQYTDFGHKTPKQKFKNEFEGKTNQFPEILSPSKKQRNKFGGQINGWLKNYNI